MNINKIIVACLVGAVLVMGSVSRGAEEQGLDFKEVYDLLRTNLAGVTETDLNQAAAEGLIGQLHPKVWLMTNGAPSVSTTGAILRTTVYDKAYGYFRIGQIQPGTDKQLRTAYQNLSSSNRLKGLVLDLRFAEGRDYEAAAAVADLFFSNEQPLINYGQGLKKSTAKENALTLPLALLVNRKTAEAAEALAGMLRQADIGVAIGSPTAGQALLFKEFRLKTGQRLQVALAPVKVGQDKALPVTGLKPEIAVGVSLQDELAYLSDAYKELTKPAGLAKAAAGGQLPSIVSIENGKATNRFPHRRLNEAELVRMLREGELPDFESNTTARGLEKMGPAIQDPALLRALDLLKGLAVLQQARKL